MSQPDEHSPEHRFAERAFVAGYRQCADEVKPMVDELKAKVAALKAENERLREAGDAVALDYAERIEIEAGEPAESLMRTLPVLKAWHAAKGVQP